jgi:hypothetical protein
MQFIDSRGVTMIPDHILSAIDSAITSARTPLDERSISAGDIRRVKNGTLERLALVLKVNSDTNTTQFTLVHSYVEFATEHDVIIEPAVTQLRYSIVVETDLRAVISTADVGGLVAVVPQKIVAACFEGPDGFIEEASMFLGLPLLGPLDARWDFKVEEGEAIRELSSAAIVSFENLESQWIFEFDEIFAALLQPVDDAPAMALAMYELWLIKGDSLAITPDHIVLFDDRGLLSRDTWSGALGESGIHFFDSVIIGFIERARSSINSAAKSPEQTIGLYELRELQYA